MQRTDAEAAGRAAPVGNDEAPAVAPARGFKDGLEGGTEGILRASDLGGKPVSSIDDDLPAYLKLKAAARDGWQLSRIVAAGAPLYILRRLRFCEAFHSIDELAAFLASRGVRL